MGKWQAVAAISVIILVVAAAVVWFVFNKASKTLDKAKGTADVAEKFTSSVKETINSGKRIWELFSSQSDENVYDGN